MSDYSLIAKVNNNDTFLKSRTQDVISRNALQTRVDNTRSFTLQNAVDYNEERFKNDFTNSLTAVNNKYEQIKELYKQFYNNGISYDKDGNPIQGADATDYADRYQFAEFLHELYPDLSVDYFMRNAEDFIYRATGVKADVKTYWDHIGNIAEASWKNAGNSLATVMEYFGGSLSGKFGTKDFQNTKEERAKKTAVSGASYRKDLGDEKYDGLIQKMFAGTIEQSPQMAIVAGMTILSLATGGISGTGGITGLLAMKNIANANKIAKGFRIAGEAANFFFSGLMDAGDFMAEVSQAGASDEAAYAAGLAILASTGFLETWGDDTLLKPVDKIAKSIFSYKDNKVVNQAVKSAWKIIGEGFLNKAKQVGTSEITETAQEEVEYLASVFAKQLVYYYEKEHGNILDKEELGITSDQVVDSIVETAKQTLLSTPFMTLGSSVLASGVDLVFGPTSAQWAPKKYMNKEGATNVVANGNFIVDTIKQSKTKTDSNGKADPIKAHMIGSQVFIDEELSPKQYEAIKNSRAIFITNTEKSKLITTSREQLDSDAIKVDATLTADEAQNFLSKAEEDGKLKGYGFAKEEGTLLTGRKNSKWKNGLSEQNDGDATILYMEIEGVDNPIKIQIEEEEKDSKNGSEHEAEKSETKKNEGLSVQDQFIKNIEREGEEKAEVDEDPFQELQDITGIKYKEFETLAARSERIRKAKQKLNKYLKDEKKRAKKDAKATSTPENTTQATQTTTQQAPKTEPETDIIAEIEAQKAAKKQSTQETAATPQATGQQTAEATPQQTSKATAQQTVSTTKKYDVKKSIFPNKYLRENSKTPIELAEYLDKDGNVLPEGTKGEYLALTDPNGNTKVVNVKDVKESTLNKILSNAKNSGVDKNTANKTYAKEKNASKKQAQTTVGITPDEGKSVQTVSQKEESDKKTMASKAEKAKNAGSVYNIKTFFPNMGVTDADGVPVRGASDLDYQFEGTYELVNENGETVDNLEDAKAFIGTDTDGKEYVFKMGELNKEDFEYFVDEATQIKTTPTEAANTVTEQQYTKKVNEVQKDSGTDRDTAENAVLATVSVKNALEQQGVKLSLDDAVNKLKEKGAIKNFENAKNLTQSVRAISETLFAMDGADSVLSELFDEQGVTEKITPKTFAKLFHAYLRNDENIDFTENQILFFEELKDGLLAQYENISTTLTPEQQQEKKAIEEGDGVMLQILGERAVERLDASHRLTSLPKKLIEAQELRKQGVDIETIWKKTGWYWGVDGKWRTEVEDFITFPKYLSGDTPSELENLHRKVVPITDFIREPYIFDAYPNARKLKVHFRNDLNGRGAFVRSHNGIVVNPRELGSINAIESTLVHEFQHFIQSEEDFGRGANEKASSLFSDTFSDERDFVLKVSIDVNKYNALISKVYELEDILEADPKGLADKKGTLWSYLKRTLRGKYAGVSEGNYNGHLLIDPIETGVDYSGEDTFFNKFAIAEEKIMSTPLSELTFQALQDFSARVQSSLYELENTKFYEDKSIDDLIDLFGLNVADFWNGLVNKDNIVDVRKEYSRTSGEVEARNTQKRLALRKKGVDVDDFMPLMTQDTRSKLQIVVDWDNNYLLNIKDEQVLKYQDSTEEVQNDIDATRVETEKISSPFKYNKDTQQYFFDSVGAYNNIREVMIAENGGDLSNIEQIENDAKLGAIFLSSLAPDVQDKIIKRSIDSSEQSKDLNNGAKSNLLRLFFSADEYTGEIGDTSRMKGASLTRSAKILLTEHSDESTVVHEVGHVAWHVDPSFRDRAKTEYGKYFREDENGVGIRTVVEANPDRFGGMTADDMISALKRLTADDYDPIKDKKTEEAIMYMFEAYRDGRDTIAYSEGIKGLFERLAKFVKDVADKILKHYGVDILHETNNAIYGPLLENATEFLQFSKDQSTTDINTVDQNLHPNRKGNAVKRLVVSSDGNTEIWKGKSSLVITHTLHVDNLEAQLNDDGKMPAISLAVKKPNNVSWTTDNTVMLVGNAEMAERVAKNGELYAGDIYSDMYPDVKEDFRFEKFFDIIESLVQNKQWSDEKTLSVLLQKIASLRSKFKYENTQSLQDVINAKDYIDVFNAIYDISEKDKTSYIPNLDDSLVFKELGDGFEKYYFDILLKDLIKNKGKFSDLELFASLRSAIIAELYPETASYLDIFDNIAMAQFYKYDMEDEEKARVKTILNRIDKNSDIYKKYEPEVLRYYHDNNLDIDINSYTYDISDKAIKKTLYGGEEATAENIQKYFNSKKQKGATAYGSLRLRVLAMKELHSLADAHKSEKHLNNVSSDFGTEKQEKEFDKLYYNAAQSIGSQLATYLPSRRFFSLAEVGNSILNKVSELLSKLEPQDNDMNKIRGSLGSYLSSLYSISLENREELVNKIFSLTQSILDFSGKLATPYFEAKKRELTNVSDFNLALVSNRIHPTTLLRLIPKLESLGLKVIVYDASLSNSALGELFEQYESSIEGDSEQVMFQTMGEVIGELKKEKSKDYTESQIRFEEQVYKYINSKVDFSNSFIDQWRAKNLDTFVDDNALQDLQNQLQNSGLFEVIDNQLNLSENTANYIKKNVTERIAYEGEDYVTFADKIGEKLKKLSNRDGYVREYTDAVKDALYLLYGYRADVPGKKKQNNKRATGILSKSFINGGARVGVAMDSLTKKFMSAKKVLEEKGMKFTLTEKDIKTFLNPAEWKANAKDGTQLFKYGSDMSASGLEFKLAEKGLSTQKLAEFLSLMVSQTEDGYIPIAWRENDEAGISPVQGPLIDALNYAHKTDSGTLTSKTPKGFSQNSYNDAEEGYLTAAYNKFAERNIPLTEGTLSSSAILLDQYKADYLSAIEVLNGKEGMNDIFGKEINVDAIEQMKKEAGERITTTREQVAEVEEINELFQKEILTERGLLQQLGDIITSIENDSKNGISISKESFQRLSDLIKQIGEKKDNKSTARINSLDAKLTAQKKSAAEKREARKAAFDKKLEKVNKENKDKIENIKKKNDEKIQKLNEKNDKKVKWLNERIDKWMEKCKTAEENKKTVRQKANELFRAVFDPNSNAKVKGLEEDTRNATQHVLDLLKDLRNENENLVKEKEQLITETTAINERLKSKLGIEVATAKDFDNAGVLPIFRAGVKELRSVASNSGTAEIRERLGNILDAFTNPSNLGTDLYIGEIFNGQDLYSSTNTKNYLKYKNDFDELRTWLYDNMGARKGPMNVITIVKTINQLNTRQLAEFIDLVNKVSKDSKNYFAEMTEKENQYYDTWEDTIVSEIEQFAKLKGKDISQLTDEDALGTKGAKDVLSSAFGKLLSEFALQSVKYRDRFPTLYAYIFGGLDHEGKVYGGLNGAANAVDENFRKDVDDINKLVISKLSGTQFVKGELTDKNLRRKWNEVKNYFKTQLGEAEFDDDAKQKIGYRIDTFRDSEGILRYEVEVDEKSDSAMKQVANYLGKLEIQKRKAQAKLDNLLKSITKMQDRISTNADTIAKAQSDIKYWKDAKVWVSGSKFGQPVTEEDRKAQIKRLTERVASVTDTLKRNREVLERKEEKVPILKERIAAFEKIGKRPNENMAKYTTQELLSIYMYAKQEGGINRLVYSPTQEGDAASSNTNNLDIGNIIWVIKQFEENDEYAPLRELADELSVIASRNFEAVRKTKFFLSNGQVLLDPIEHYFSFVADTSEMYNFGPEVDLGGFDKPAEGKTTKDSRRAKASDVMTQERGPNVVRGLNLSVLDRAYSSMYQQEYYISMGEKIESLKRLLSNDKFQTAFKDYYGRNKGVQNLKSLGKYVNSLSNTQRDFDNSAVSGIVRFFTNNTAVGAMAFSLPTVLQQIPTMLWCLKDPHIGLKGVLTALHRATTDKSLYGLSPQMKERANSAIQSIRATKNLGSAFSAKFNNYTIEQAITMTQDAGLWLLEKADNYIANAMWYATFEGVRSEYEALDDNNAKKQQFLALSTDEQEQLIANEATQRVLDISPVQGGKDNAAAYSTSNAYVRQLLLFTNQTTKMLNGIVGGFRDVDVKGKTYLARVLAVSIAVLMLNGIINGKMWRKTKDDDDDEEEVNILKNIPYTLWEGVIDLIPGLDSILSDDKYGTTSIPSDLENILNVFKKDPDMKTQNQMANAWANLLTDVMSTIGLAGNEARRVYRAFRDKNILQAYNSKYGELLEH